MKKAVHNLLERLSSFDSSGLILVGIDGCGGAGKSTIAEELAVELADCQLVHVDDFYKPKEQRIEINEDVPVHSNFEFKKLKQEVLTPIKQGNPVICITPTGKDVKVKPHGYVIVEGLGTLGNELRDYFDFKVWVDAKESVRRSRGIHRDTKEWAAIWDNEFLPQDARYMREQVPQDAADIVLGNN